MPEKEDFEEIKLNAENNYKSVVEVYCPYFKEKIVFNSEGLEHLKFKRHEKPRSEQEQHMRFKLLGLAPEVIRSSHTLQGLREIRKFERMRNIPFWRISKKTGTRLFFEGNPDED